MVKMKPLKKRPQQISKKRKRKRNRDIVLLIKVINTAQSSINKCVLGRIR